MTKTTFQNNRITQKGEALYFIRADGSDYEIGLTKGREMASDVHAAWDFFEPRMGAWFSTPEAKYGETHQWLQRNLERIAPWMVDQLCGMAEGSRLSIEKIFLINHYAVLWSANGLFCTSIALRDMEAGPVLGQNLDIGPEDLYFVEELHPQQGYATLSDGMAGCAGRLRGSTSTAWLLVRPAFQYLIEQGLGRWYKGCRMSFCRGSSCASARMCQRQSSI